jgi:hypothetical protein
MISAWRNSSMEFRGCRSLPPPLPHPTPCRSLRRPLPPLMGRNPCQDSSTTNNTLNNNNRSKPTRRRITATVVVAAVAAAPLTPLLPRVHGPPTSTPGSALFKCGWVSGVGQHPGTSLASAGYAGQRPSLWSSTVCWATFHATTRTFVHPPWSVAGSNAFGSSGMVPMDELVRSTIVGQLLQHHSHGLSYGHRLGGRL